MARERGTGSVLKQKDGSWLGSVLIGYYDSGKPKYKRFKGAKQKDVVAKMEEFKLQTKNLQIIPKDSNEKVYDYIKNFVDVYKSKSIKPTSLTRNYGILENQIKGYVGDYRVKELTSDIIQRELINALADKGYSLSTIHKAYVLLNEALNNAIEDNIIFKNPCSKVDLPSKSIIPPKKIEILTKEDIANFVKAAESNKTNSLQILLVLYTGLRCGELCALKWSDINFEDKILTVQRNVISSKKNVNGKLVRCVEIENGTKTRMSRKIPLNNNAMNILNRLKEEYGDSEFIVQTSSPIPDVSNISKQYDRLVAYAGIKGKTGIHTLRHTFASMLIERGMEINFISEILGHSSISFTYNTYIHLFEEQKAKNIKMLDDLT